MNTYLKNSHFSCRLCDTNHGEVVFEDGCFPKSIWPNNMGTFEVFIPLEAIICKNCGHLQLSNYPDDFVSTFYQGNDFVLAESCPKQHRFQVICQDYVELNTAKSKIIDVGGGVNSIVGHFSNEVHKVVADYAFSQEILADDSIEKLSGDFNQIPLPEDQFDGIFLFHCLEHINHPKKLLKMLLNALKSQGRLYIEVPDSNYYAKNAPYYLFFHQHLNLFCEQTIYQLLSSSGFYVEKKYDIEGVLFLVAQKNKQVTNSKYSQNYQTSKDIISIFSNNMQSIRNQVQNLYLHLPENGKIALYGAGGSGKLFFHHFLKPFEINVAYDQDYKKHGKYLYQGKGLIKNPAQIKIDRPDIMLFHNLNLYRNLKDLEGIGRAVLLK